MSINTHTSRFVSVLAVGAVALSASHSDATRPASATFANTWSGARTTYLVQASDSIEASDSVRHVGAAARGNLDVIKAVAADLDDAQVAKLSANPRLRLYKDRSVSTRTLLGDTVDTLVSFVDGTGMKVEKSFESNYPKLVAADVLHQSGITGRDVTIAVLDTGLWKESPAFSKGRVLASVDVMNGFKAVDGDAYGHGTHVASIAAGDALTKGGDSLGIAPQARLVIVRAFDGQGAGSYANVIAGINWIVANRVKYKIRVLNLSFGAPPQSNYWDDPLNQAVMAAWKAGIVVVAAAGNEGPDPMTIGVPGNVPYVITAGALTDNYTPYNITDDRLASFSSTGPTLEGFVKPDVVAPGGHMVASMQYQSYLANIDPGSMKKDQSLFTMSGTSQAAAVTSGVVALMLQADPTLTPDTVKCRLLASASPAVKADGALAYSIFQQGAGLVNAVAAVRSPMTGCANQGLNISADLAGTNHFGGPANQDANGNYYIMDMEGTEWGSALSSDGYTWSQGYTWTKGYTWTSGYTWTNGYTWTRGYTWTKGYTWTSGYTWSTGYTWSKTLPWWDGATQVNPAAKAASVSSWIPNE